MAWISVSLKASRFSTGQRIARNIGLRCTPSHSTPWRIHWSTGNTARSSELSMLGNLRRVGPLGRDAGNAIKNVGAAQGAEKQPVAIDHGHRQAWFEQARHFHQL